MDEAAIQQKIALDQQHIISSAESASFNGVNWLVTRVTGTDVTREDVTHGGPQADYTPHPPPGIYTDETKIVDTMTTTQTLGSTSSSVVQDTSINTYTPDPSHTKTIMTVSGSTTASGDPLDYQDVGILFSPDGGTDVNLHPIELFKTLSGTQQSTAYESFSDVPSFEYGANTDPVTTRFDPYLTYTMDDALDARISTPDQESVLSTLLNLDVTATPDDLAHLQSGVENALSSVIMGEAFLGSLANRVLGQQAYNEDLVDALASGVGSLVDADMNTVSTRLTALQTQQQLGLQALSIANDNVGLVLKLFGGG